MFEARRAWIKWRVLGIRNEHFTIIAQLRSLLTIGRFLRIVVLSQFPGRNENVSSSRPPVSASSSHSLSLALSFIHESHTLALAVSTNGRSLWDDARPQLGKSMAMAFASEYVSNDLKLIELTYSPLLVSITFHYCLSANPSTDSTILPSFPDDTLHRETSFSRLRDIWTSAFA